MKKIVKIVAIVVAVVLVAAFVAPMLLRGKIAQIVKREANETVSYTHLTLPTSNHV